MFSEHCVWSRYVCERVYVAFCKLNRRKLTHSRTVCMKSILDNYNSLFDWIYFFIYIQNRQPIQLYMRRRFFHIVYLLSANILIFRNDTSQIITLLSLYNRTWQFRAHAVGFTHENNNNNNNNYTINGTSTTTGTHDPEDDMSRSRAVLLYKCRCNQRAISELLKRPLALCEFNKRFNAGLLWILYDLLCWLPMNAW